MKQVREMCALLQTSVQKTTARKQRCGGVGGNHMVKDRRCMYNTVRDDVPAAGPSPPLTLALLIPAQYYRRTVWAATSTPS